MDCYGRSDRPPSDQHRGGGRKGIPTSYAPPSNTVQRGTIQRIETYGAFVQLRDYRARGLVHKSQLSKIRIESVEDVIDLNDEVFVKVTDVTQEIDEETGKVRHRVSLSLRYADQENGTDLDPDGIAAAADASRRGNRGDGTPGDPSTLEQNLNSTIGMGLAIDPLATMRQVHGGRLVLKGSREKGGVLFNGYALVDDDEGEVSIDHTQQPIAPPAPVNNLVRPMGRGRGSTLPAWMTRLDTDPTGDSLKRQRGRLKSRSRSPGSVGSFSSNSCTLGDRRHKRKHKSRRYDSGEKEKNHRKDKHRSRDRNRDKIKGSSRNRHKERRLYSDRKDHSKNSPRCRSKSRSHCRHSSS